MNTTYAKAKIEKIMARALHPTTDKNEAQVSYEMAKKVAEKYKVLTWFYLTYEANIVNQHKEEKKPIVIKNWYNLSNSFRWDDITNTLVRTILQDEKMCNLFNLGKISKRTGLFKEILFYGTEEQFNFLSNAYKFVLKKKNHFCKEAGNHSATYHTLFETAFIEGFIHGSNCKYESIAFINAYNAGKEFNEMFNKFGEEMGW